MAESASTTCIPRICGYGTKYEWARNTGRPVPGLMGGDRELPDGWSLGNLQRIKPRSRYLLDGARQGVFAAHSSAPAMVHRDKSQLRFMEWIAFDDVRIDKICTIAEKGLKRQFGYPLAVFAFDVATGCDIAHIVKPWCKSWIEVFFRPFQEQLALSDGSSGNRYDNMPAQTKYALFYARELLRKAGSREEIVDKLLLPHPRFEDICDLIIEALDALRKRTDHNLQGFETITEWRRNKFDRVHTKAELDQLSDDELSQIEIWERLESPLERMNRLAKGIDFWRPDPRQYCHLLALKQVWKFAITNGGCTFTAKSLKIHKCERIQENLTFKSPSDEIIEAYTGKKMLCYFADDLSVVHLTYEGRHICACERVRRVNMLDSDAIKRAAEAAAKRNNEARAVLTPLMPAKAAELSAMREHNSGVLRNAEKLARKIRETEADTQIARAETSKRARKIGTARRAAIAAAARALEDSDEF
ncbi:hypothetical protein P3B99_007345 [Opitutia bacterium KCR 482]|nr:hypothetical protein [Opitutae bacterium KCR 482]MDF3287068.1 hypothetical protein [Opitutae bacterium KCR 482]